MRITSPLIGALALTFLSFNSLAQGPEYIPGDILIQLNPDRSADEIVAELATVKGNATGIEITKEVSAPMACWLLHFDDQAIDQRTMLRVVKEHPAVRLAQNNHIVTDRATVPNDPNYNQQWWHQNIQSEDAWDITTGGVTATGDTIVVCIIENSDLPHPDLIDNAWFNTGEVPNNGVDDDGNGYTDDHEGWNPGGNNDNVYGGSHGTQVCGMIGATGNNGTGVAGANWNVKMMVVTRDGISEAAVVESYTYPFVMRKLYNQSGGNKGAFVVATNASWGIDGGDPSSAPLWCAMYDSLGTVGVLNCGATANNPSDIDVVGDLPTACPSDFMVSVTATDVNDIRQFSAYGATTIDVGAPGDNVYTTSIGGGYGNTSGTSFASPLTAGVIGLLYSAPCASLMSLVQGDPEAGALLVRDALFDGVDVGGNLVGATVTGGRINAFNSLQEIMNNCGACPTAYNLAAQATTATEAQFMWSSTAMGPYDLRYRELGSTTWTDVPNLTTTSYTATGLQACTAYEFQVDVECDTISSGFSASFVLQPPSEPTPSIALNDDEVMCQGEQVTLTSSATNNLWSTGATGQSITVDQTGTFSVMALGVCDSASSANVNITVVQPVLPTTSDVFLPGPGVATMTATGDSIVWYDMATGGAPVGYGNSWDTPFLNMTTDYWCSNVVRHGGPVAFGGKLNNDLANGQYHTFSNNYLLFTANDEFEIISVKVYANSTGNRTIELLDENTGNTVTSGIFNIPNGESRVELNFEVPGPGDYGLAIANGTPNLWRDGLGSNPAFPFTLGSYGSITGSTAGNGVSYYYFFYDWEVAGISTYCESDREQATVDITVGIDELNGVSVSVHPVPADEQVQFQLDALAGKQVDLIITDMSGRTVHSEVSTSDRILVNTATWAEGQYLYSLSDNQGRSTRGRFGVVH